MSALSEKIKGNAPRFAIYARYLLPAVFGVFLLVFSFADGVRFYMNGRSMKMSLFAFYKNTLTAAHGYLAGTTEAQANWFYGLLSGGAILFALVYVLALGFSVLAAVTACRAFLAGQESEEGNRMKVIFKVAFPNRGFLLAANCLYLVPALFPEYFSAVGRRFLALSGKDTVFVDVNGYLIATLVMLAFTLVLSLLIKKWEYQKSMNMFVVRSSHDESPDEDGDEDEE